MLILAIQTAINPASFAIMDEAGTVTQSRISERFAVCRELASEIHTQLAKMEKRPADIDLVGVCVGPGSFTGIRIGLATAKALSEALNIPAVAVSSLELAACEAAQQSPTAIDVIMPAGKDRYFAARYDSDLQLLEKPSQLSAASAKKWLTLQTKDTGRKARVLMTIEAHAALMQMLQELNLSFAQAQISPEDICRLALAKFNKDQAQPGISLQPFYLRASSPEERAVADQTREDKRT